MITLLFVAVLLLLGRIAFVWIAPQRACRWCEGSGEWHRMRCWRCKGDGHIWRLGSRLLRKAHLAAVRVWNEREDSR